MPDRKHRWVRPAIPTFILLLLAQGWCGCGDSGPSGPGPGPDPGPGDGPSLIITRILDGQTKVIHDSAPDWTTNDDWVVFTAGPGSIIWKISTDELHRTSPVTNPDDDNWLVGGYVPFGMEHGQIGYFQGLLPGDFGMHIMRASPEQASGSPAPIIEHRLSGVAVGLPLNQLSSPRTMSFDAQGHLGIGTWTSTWFLEWLERDQESLLLSRPATGLEEATDFRVSRTGRRVGYVTGEGIVHWMMFEAEETHPLTQGSHPSFDSTGELIGYAGPSGVDYIVRNISDGTTVLYTGSSGLVLIRPVMSWDGTQIVFLGEDEGQLSLYTAELKN